MGKVKATKVKEVKEMKMMDGQAAPDFGEGARTIEDILGEKRQGPFKAKTLAEFETQLSSEMNLADMQALATRVGLIPIHDKPLLKKRLIDEFKKNIARLHGQQGLREMLGSDLDENSAQKAARILREGR